MKFDVTKSDIILMNKTFAEGKVHNEPSLDFALNYAAKAESWTKALAYIVRAILRDQVFSAANNQTAALLIKTYATHKRKGTYDERIVKLIKDIVLRNINSVTTIEGMIHSAIQ